MLCMTPDDSLIDITMIKMHFERKRLVKEKVLCSSKKSNSNRSIPNVAYVHVLITNYCSML